MGSPKILVVGGGAAGFFAAITAAQSNPAAEVTILEKSAHFLAKVKISGGGRCNVTHACFDPRALTTRYPRGERELIGPYQQFQARETVQWFEARGVKLKAEEDGRMFPTTDSSQTIIDCLTREAQNLGVKLRANSGVEEVRKLESGFELRLNTGERLACDKLLLATGGPRTPSLGALAVSLGHTLEAPVPSLFTFHIETAWVRELAGVTVPLVEASVPGTKLRERGPVLFTHWGLSGPAILRLSAWGARVLHELDYKFTLQISWLPELTEAALREQLFSRGRSQPAKLVLNWPIPPLTARLWEKLVKGAGLKLTTRWSTLGREGTHRLVQKLLRTELPVTGKSLNKDEFVTCGGVRLKEVNFKTMESRITPGLYFAGELLDIDGITGGFNFQSAWTTGYLAGRAMAAG